MAQASEIAYIRIREAILSGQLAQGQKLVEEELVKICNVSRTPVRDALKKLAFEGYIILKKNQGGWVKTWAAEEVEEVFAARALMESHIVEIAAKKARDSDLEVLAGLVDALDALIEQNLPLDELVPAFLTNNRKFHDKLYEMSENSRLCNLMQALSPPPVVHRTAQFFDAKRIQQSNHDHRMLLTALQAHDEGWARTLMRAHVQAAAVSYAAYFSENGSNELPKS